MNGHLRKYDLSFLLANRFDAPAAPLVPVMNILRASISYLMIQQQENSSSQQPENSSSTPTVEIAEPVPVVTKYTTTRITITNDGSTAVTNNDNETSVVSPSLRCLVFTSAWGSLHVHEQENPSLDNSLKP